jgi:hypothetical protein
MSDELQERVGTIEQRVAAVDGGLPPEAKERMDTVMADLRREVETLGRDIEVLRQDAARGARAAPSGGPSAPFLGEVFERLGTRLPRVQPHAPSVLAVRPELVEPGGRVRIEPRGWIPAGDFESLDFTVLSPDGQVWTARLTQDLAGVGRLSSLDFPDAFEGASSTVSGVYEVLAQRVSLDGEPLGIPSGATFVVESSQDGPRP